ncbi:uncharacterized protein [Nicotiana sylvestris]|uniref:uncharacterized protein isoform X3 n=1 Tax=Nicotiana sylvestris TaxID=4096 RepID=UPI00388C4CE6
MKVFLRLFLGGILVLLDFLTEERKTQLVSWSLSQHDGPVVQFVILKLGRNFKSDIGSVIVKSHVILFKTPPCLNCFNCRCRPIKSIWHHLAARGKGSNTRKKQSLKLTLGNVICTSS